MTIGSPSGSGATQNDIADGSDASDGRWRQMFAGALTSSAETVITTGGSGATPSFNSAGVQMKSPTDGDRGHIIVGSTGLRFGFVNVDNTASTVLIKGTFGCNTSIANLTESIGVGCGSTATDTPFNEQDIAGFRPQVGDNSTGNVRVISGATTADGSVSYPSLGEIHEYTVLLDYAGNYLTSGSTGFYIDKDPRRGDTANEIISETPTSGDDRGFGLFYGATGDNTAMEMDYLEVSVRQ